MSTTRTRLNPVAQTYGELITPFQLRDVKTAARRAGLDYSAESQRLFSCEAEELSRDAAMIFLEHLRKKSEVHHARTV